jgi:hypothetical protein
LFGSIYLFILRKIHHCSQGGNSYPDGVSNSHKEWQLDILSLTAAIVAVTGLIAAINALLRELRSWRRRPSQERK